MGMGVLIWIFLCICSTGQGWFSRSGMRCLLLSFLTESRRVRCHLTNLPVLYPLSPEHGLGTGVRAGNSGLSCGFRTVPLPACHREESERNIPEITSLFIMSSGSIPSHAGFKRKPIYFLCPLQVLQSVLWWWHVKGRSTEVLKSVTNFWGLKTITYLFTVSPSSSFSVPCRMYFRLLCGKYRLLTVSL